MTALLATDTDAGRSCPYCRFALKVQVPIERCTQCGSIYHEDCWRDAGGCSIFGCSGGATATAPPPPATEALPVQPPPPPAGSVPLPPPPQPRSGGSSRTRLLALAVVLLVALAGAGGVLLATRDDDGEEAGAAAHTQASAEAPVAVPESTPTSAPPEEATQKPTPDAEARAQRSAERIEAVVAFSLEGRSAILDGRYDDAIANRRSVLRRLRAIRGTSGGLNAAKRTLERAMQASLDADIHYRDGTDASASNAEATRLKQVFVEQWASVASEYGLSEYAPGDI